MAALLGVPDPAPRPSPTAPPPLAVTRTFRPYYSPLELDHLVHLQATQRAHSDHHAHPGQHADEPQLRMMSEQRIEAYRQLAAGFIERVATRLGFPRRTIATAQKLYHRFHLHFSLNEFAYQDVSLSALLVASKLEDTLKKLRDIQIAAWQVANMMEGGEGRGEGDPAAQEAHRPHLIGIERLIMQTISFNFNLHRSFAPSSGSTTLPDDPSTEALYALAAPPPSRDAFSSLLRLSSALPSLPSALLPSSLLPSSAAHESTRKTLTHLSFLLLTDLHRTLAPLAYPPHTCAAACLWTAGWVLVEATSAAGEGEKEGRWEGMEGWEEKVESAPGDIDDIAQTLLSLLIALCPTPPSSSAPSSGGVLNPLAPSPSFSPSPFSPSEPSSLPSSSSKPAAAVLSERDKHLVAAGVPNAFTHPAALPGGGRGEGGGGGGKGQRGFASAERLTEIKIRLRSARVAQEAAVPSGRPKRPRSASPSVEDEDVSALQHAKRWAALAPALADVGRLRDERDERERVRAEERAERERERVEALAAAAGADGEESAGSQNGGGGRRKTEEERERERRERRERARPGSVRYRF
ncbi:hypothetical protein JCM10207_007483 [Rhodosporidiobolus poonsookiae]